MASKKLEVSHPGKRYSADAFLLYEALNCTVEANFILNDTKKFKLFTVNSQNLSCPLRSPATFCKKHLTD